MPCTPESVAAVLRSLADPHEEVVSAAAVAILSPSFTTDEPMWTKIADALLRALREKAARDPWKSYRHEPDMSFRDPTKDEAHKKWVEERKVFYYEPARAILRTLATRPELRRHARDAVPELIIRRPWFCAVGQYGDDSPREDLRYEPDVASPDTRHLSPSPFPRFRNNFPYMDTSQLTRDPEWPDRERGGENISFRSLMDRIGRANDSDLPALEKLLTLEDLPGPDWSNRKIAPEAARAVVRTMASAEPGPMKYAKIDGPKYHPLVVAEAKEYAREEARK